MHCFRSRIKPALLSIIYEQIILLKYSNFAETISSLLIRYFSHISDASFMASEDALNLKTDLKSEAQIYERILKDAPEILTDSGL